MSKKFFPQFSNSEILSFAIHLNPSGSRTSPVECDLWSATIRELDLAFIRPADTEDHCQTRTATNNGFDVEGWLFENNLRSPTFSSLVLSCGYIERQKRKWPIGRGTFAKWKSVISVIVHCEWKGKCKNGRRRKWHDRISEEFEDSNCKFSI